MKNRMKIVSDQHIIEIYLDNEVLFSKSNHGMWNYHHKLDDGRQESVMVRNFDDTLLNLFIEDIVDQSEVKIRKIKIGDRIVEIEN